MKPYDRRKKLEAIFRAKKWHQFGSENKTTSAGSEGCTHEVLKALIYLWTGQDVTQDQISAVAGYKPSDVGMNSGHVDAVIKHYKLPYVATWRLPGGAPSTSDLVQTVRNLGPALLAVDYGLYPLGVGGPNEAIQGGRTDLTFAGNHAVCVFAARWLRKAQTYRIRGMDPDHGSPARPDIPEYDIYTVQQLGRLWRHDLVGKSYGQFGYVPTIAWEGVGK